MDSIKKETQILLRKYIKRLRNVDVIEKFDYDIIPKIKTDNDNPDLDASIFIETGHRVVNESSDILELMAHLISKINNHNYSDVKCILDEMFQESFKIGNEKTFDHGKFSSFILLHEMHNLYTKGREGRTTSTTSFHRPNFYYDIMDSAVAIYMHNPLKWFKLYDKWGTYTPLIIPPLSYLLALCDQLVEWDKPEIGK